MDFYTGTLPPRYADAQPSQAVKGPLQASRQTRTERLRHAAKQVLQGRGKCVLFPSSLIGL
jgi:hypothetical protein